MSGRSDSTPDGFAPDIDLPRPGLGQRCFRDVVTAVVVTVRFARFFTVGLIGLGMCTSLFNQEDAASFGACCLGLEDQHHVIGR